MTLHTVATIEKDKLALVDNGVPYLRQLQSADPRSTRAHKLEYWNDYTQEGLETFARENPSAESLERKGGQSTEAQEMELLDDEESEDHSTVMEYAAYGTIDSVLVKDEGSQTLLQGNRARDDTSPSRLSTTTSEPLDANPSPPMEVQDHIAPLFAPRMVVTAKGSTVVDLQVIEQRAQH